MQKLLTLTLFNVTLLGFHQNAGPLKILPQTGDYFEQFSLENSSLNAPINCL